MQRSGARVYWLRSWVAMPTSPSRTNICYTCISPA